VGAILRKLLKLDSDFSILRKIHTLLLSALIIYPEFAISIMLTDSISSCLLVVKTSNKSETSFRSQLRSRHLRSGAASVNPSPSIQSATEHESGKATTPASEVIVTLSNSSRLSCSHRIEASVSPNLQCPRELPFARLYHLAGSARQGLGCIHEAELSFLALIR